MLRRTSKRVIQPQLALGLVQEFAPQWPLPLPPPLREVETSRATLILDIDETLLHTIHYDRHEANKQLVEYHVLLRPHVDVFLREVSELFEVVFWTAGVSSYAAAMVNLLERTVGIPESSIYSAKKLLQIQDDVASETKDMEDPTSWYVLSRQQTLTNRDYMKYIPLIGRDPNRVAMIDDNERSFPLTPRQGIKIAPFRPNDSVMGGMAAAVSELQQRKMSIPDLQSALAASEKGSSERQSLAALAAAISRGWEEMDRIRNDRVLLDILPMLRSIAAAVVTKESNVVKELDYWRPNGYEACDEFKDNLRIDSTTRRALLGHVVPTRRDTPIAPIRQLPHNYPIVEETKQLTTELWRAFGADDKSSHYRKVMHRQQPSSKM